MWMTERVATCRLPLVPYASHRRSWVLGLALLCVSCASDAPSGMAAADAAPTENAMAPERETIGAAEMDRKRVITLYLSAFTPDMVTEAVLVYKPGDPRYEYVLKHIGPIKPGESKAVYPFPKDAPE